MLLLSTCPFLAFADKAYRLMGFSFLASRIKHIGSCASSDDCMKMASLQPLKAFEDSPNQSPQIQPATRAQEIPSSRAKKADNLGARTTSPKDPKVWTVLRGNKCVRVGIHCEIIEPASTKLRGENGGLVTWWWEAYTERESASRVFKAGRRPGHTHNLR